MRLIELTEMGEIRAGQIPGHIAVIMDGNGRWASFRGRVRTDGHYAARQPMLDSMDAALELGIKWLSFFAFSTENWRRPNPEINVLMDFATWFFRPKTVRFLIENEVRLHFIGEILDERIPSKVRARFSELAHRTAKNNRLNIVLAFNYGGRSEIAAAVRAAIASQVIPSTITVATLREFMYLPAMPDVDLLIRTSGEQRLSNFFLWHLAYSELIFFDTLWPEFTSGHLYTAVAEFQRRRRRFGGLPGDSTDMADFID